MVDDEEKIQLRLDNNRLRQTIKHRDEMIEEMEEELSKLGRVRTPSNDPSAKERDLSAQLLDLQIECDNKVLVISKQAAEIEELKKETDRLERSNRELANRSIYSGENDDSSSSLVEAELLKTSEELERLKKEREHINMETSELKKDLIDTRAQLEETMDHIKSLERHSTEQSEEITRLESEIFEMKNGGTSHASRGNSIFAEAIEAERKLEEDLKVLYNEKIALQRMVKRLMIEKEDAEQMARNALNRNITVRTAIADVDFKDLIRLRTKVEELEREKTVLWEKLFITMKKVPKKDLGPLIQGYFESFRCSIESLKLSFDDTVKKNDELVLANRRLKLEVHNIRQQNEEYSYEIESLNRKLNNKIALENPTSIKPRKESPKYNIPSFLKKTYEPVRTTTASTRTLESSMKNVSMLPQVTPQKPATKNENDDDWAERTLAKRRAKKETPQVKYNYVELKMPVKTPSSIFKPQTLRPNTTENERNGVAQEENE